MARYRGGMRLLLVRHGRTASNAAHLLDTAFPGAELDDLGHAQARRLVDVLAREHLSGIFASDLIRTQQTAAPLAAARGLEVGVLGGVREIQAGQDELSPVWDRYVSVLTAWVTGDHTAAVPGGEDALSFYARYDEAVRVVADAGHASALVVSHGAAIRMWVGGRARGITPKEVAERRLGNTAVLTLEGDPDDGWRLVSWAEGHLDEHRV